VSFESGSRPLRVAIVAASPAIIGGHSVQASALASALAADGVDVELVAIDRAYPRGLRWARRIRGLRTVVNEALYAGALARLGRADIVHAFSASYWSFLLAPVPAMIAGRARGQRVILHYHSGEVADHLARWGSLVHPWLRLADELVVCSAFQQEAFRAYGHRATVIPNVIDLERFPFRPRVPLGPRFISTRNLEPHYRVDVVIDAFARIRAVHPDATLVVAGRGSEEAALRRKAAAREAGGVRFVGAVAPADMPRTLDAADIFLNASAVDNQPVSIIEAAASGLPIVSTRAGGIAEFIEDDVSGTLVPRSDPDRLAQAALALLERPHRAVAMAERARESVARFTWAAVRQRWDAVYGLAGTLHAIEAQA
jgi:glycosyltransferase involved in cell wall biosynthesis